MESKLVRWGFKNETEGSVSNRILIEKIKASLKKDDVRETINLGNGDPTPFPSFKTTSVAEEALLKLAQEESVILLPGIALGLKNWVRVTFATEPSYVDDAFRRIKAFYARHAKKQTNSV